MSANVLLITFPGYPNEPLNFMPDNGLATLAACLMSRGHRVVIKDFMTVDIIRRLFPYKDSESLKETVAEVMGSLRRGEKPSTLSLDRYYRLDDAVQEYKKEQIREMGRELAEYVARERFDFVGMKLWTGGGFAGSIQLAAEIRRRNPGTLLVGGGPHVDWFMEQVFDVTDVFDILSYGEGENVIARLADYVEGKTVLEDIPNLIYKKDGRVVTTSGSVVDDLNTVPSPVYDAAVYPAMEGNQKLKALLIEESRGCPNTCSFCIHPSKSGRKRRSVRAQRVTDEIERAVTRYGIRAFRLSGSNPPAQLLRAIAGEILRRGLAVRYTAYAHVKGFVSEDFSLLRDSGCSALAFGVESGSQRILDGSLNKRVKIDDIRNTLLLCRESGVKVVASIIMPAPHETEETKQETFDLLRAVRPDATNVFFPTLIYGTEWEKNKERYGFQIKDPTTLFREAMTYDINHFAPPVLWAPLSDYRVNGKSFSRICEETAFFIQRLEKEKLTTQLFDQNLLLSEFSGMSPFQFGNVTHEYLRNGEYDAMRSLIGAMNERIQNFSSALVA